MTMLSKLRDGLIGRSGRDDPDPASEAGGEEAGKPPFEGYDRLSDAEVIQDLSHHSQVELTAIDDYERAHGNRKRVLDKLRYMRGSEPIPGYDAMEADAVIAAVGDADLATLEKARSYERKFANRPDVLDAIAHAHKARSESEPAKEAPAYQSASAASQMRRSAEDESTT